MKQKGRKPLSVDQKKVCVQIYLRPDVIRELEKMAEKIPLGEVIENLLRAHPEAEK